MIGDKIGGIMKLIKRRFFKLFAILLGLFIAAVLNVFISVCFTKLEKVEVDADKLSGGNSLNVLQISDVHNKRSMNSNQQLIRLVMKAQPDIVVITGDLIDDNTTNLENVYALIEKMIAINPNIYFVTGNHEWRGGLAEELKQGLAQRGVNILDNKAETISINGINLNICVVDDWTSGRQNLDKALRGIDESLFTIMLAHDPGIIYNFSKYTPDLTLSGHTHGGQVRLPIVGAIVAPGQGLFPKLDKGIYEIRNKLLYIDSGVGTSVFPIRFLNRSQVTLMKIR